MLFLPWPAGLLRPPAFHPTPAYRRAGGRALASASLAQVI